MRASFALQYVKQLSRTTGLPEADLVVPVDQLLGVLAGILADAGTADAAPSQLLVVGAVPHANSQPDAATRAAGGPRAPVIFPAHWGGKKVLREKYSLECGNLKHVFQIEIDFHYLWLVVGLLVACLALQPSTFQVN